MSTIDKALSILDLFSESRPSMGSTEIARTLHWDKSNVQRYVNDLAARGLLEQDQGSKKYYLGPTLNRLSMVRARTHPVDREVRRILADLVAETGETAHASTLVGTNLTTSAIVETSIRGTRVYIDPAEFLPFHASGSGIACLAAMPDKDVSTLLAPGYPRFTELTPADFSDVAARIDEARQRGYVTLLGTYERDVVGIAAAVVGYDGVVGAVAVAAPVARFHPEVERLVSGAVMAAARQLSRLYGAPTGDTTS